MKHFQTLDDLREYVKNLREYIKKGQGTFCARPITSGGHPTLYLDESQGTMVNGIREKDYLFSPCKGYVLAHTQMGLSFSAHWQHLKGQLKMKEKHNKGKAINVYWILSGADIPSGLKFVADERNKKHYFLTVTDKKMPIGELAEKLTRVANAMSVISDARKAL
ncbi:MAG: hypothetical protein L3J89_09110 [Gammaproteobacteria bacterium]|nr:hypothetical protein [Gammaproteobacteria bacterium]MCF6324467.1 hypothetical protein [Gammaproteobacteria bacterium]